MTFVSWLRGEWGICSTQAVCQVSSPSPRDFHLTRRNPGIPGSAWISPNKKCLWDGRPQPPPGICFWSSIAHFEFCLWASEKPRIAPEQAWPFSLHGGSLFPFKGGCMCVNLVLNRISLEMEGCHWIADRKRICTRTHTAQKNKSCVLPQCK